VNPALPELLDYIVAKMLAKPLEERYQDAAELARDLREGERQLATPGAAPPSAAAQPAAQATPPEPTLLAATQKTIVLAQSVNRTREADQAAASAPSPARGLASSFDSSEATQRLASLTGLAQPQTATQAIKSMPRAAPRRWRRRDWLVLAGAGVCGVLLAGAILRRGR
jgi:serine/threonine-protein kinase